MLRLDSEIYTMHMLFADSYYACSDNHIYKPIIVNDMRLIARNIWRFTRVTEIYDYYFEVVPYNKGFALTADGVFVTGRLPKTVCITI